MKSIEQIKAFFHSAAMETNPDRDEAVFADASRLVD